MHVDVFGSLFVHWIISKEQSCTIIFIQRSASSLNAAEARKNAA